jgi:hypothetical protein
LPDFSTPTLEGRKMPLAIFNGMSPTLNRSPRQHVAVRIATALHASEARLRLNERRREPTDQQYLDQLARRLADDTGLPLPLAQKRVRQLAASPRGGCRA